MTNAYLLYIDPGTGSMLFSILIGAAATLFFLGKAVILKLKIFFSGRQNGLQQDSSFKSYVIYCEGRQYQNLFKPICDEFEKRAIPLSYLTSVQYAKPFVKTFFPKNNEFYATFLQISLFSGNIPCS